MLEGRYGRLHPTDDHDHEAAGFNQLFLMLRTVIPDAIFSLLFGRASRLSHGKAQGSKCTVSTGLHFFPPLASIHPG